MVTEQRREVRARSLQGALEGVRFNYPIGQRTAAKWDIQAGHVLHADLENGEDEGGASYVYHLTDAQRDRLLAHARQDAAHAVFGVHDAFQEARMSRRLSAISVWLNLAMLGILIFVVAL